MKLLSFNTRLCCLLVALTVMTAQADTPSETQSLLEKVKQERAQERQRIQEREARFLAAKEQQASLLAQAKTDFERFQRQNNPLKQETLRNQERIEELQAQIQKRKDETGDLDSVFRQMSQELAERLTASSISMQLPARQEQLNALLQGERTANIEQMEALWLLMQEEITLSGEIASFSAPVIQPDGQIITQTVTRAGNFSSYVDGQFLRFIPETQEYLLTTQQSAESQQNRRWFAAENELDTLYLDPTDGTLLAIMAWTPDWRQRIEQGGVIGKIILALGALGLLLVCWRAIALLWQQHTLKRQCQSLSQARSDNALGRVILRVAELPKASNADNSDILGMAQVHLDEAVLTEVNQLEKGHNLIKLLAATAPLLGLLGTVTGMIVTFQSISFFGSGDPKLMASGISQALVTTVLGLLVAIPLLFGHSFVSSLADNLIRRLDEQSAGLLTQYLNSGKSGAQPGSK